MTLCSVWDGNPGLNHDLLIGKDGDTVLTSFKEELKNDPDVGLSTTGNRIYTLPTKTIIDLMEAPSRMAVKNAMKGAGDHDAQHGSSAQTRCYSWQTSMLQLNV